MKKLTMVIMSVLLTLCSGVVNAQEKADDQKKMSREELAVTQARHIARSLALDQSTGELFIKTYCECQKEVWALGPRIKSQNEEVMSDEEIDKAIKAKFERSEKLLEIRQKYYEKYSEFMTPEQIQRAYQLEKQMMERLSRNHRGRR